MKLKFQINTNHALIFLLAALCAPLNANAEVTTAVRGEAVSKADIAALPPVCKLIMENPGIHHYVGQVKNAALFERPEYLMAKGNEHLHHYCWALISKQRYFRERNKGKRNHYFVEFMGDIDYVLKYSDKSWPYFDAMLVEQGQMLLIRGDYPASLHKANVALGHKADSEKAHLLKFDTYEAMGNKKAAIEAAKEGLGKNPDSDRLRKRLVSRGVTVPPKHQPKPADPEVSVTHTIENTEKEGAETLKKLTAPSVPSNTESHTEPETKPAQSTTKSNPYCRFCP